MLIRLSLVATLLLTATGCDESIASDAGSTDAGSTDSGAAADATSRDASGSDSGGTDAATGTDAAADDAAVADATTGTDAAMIDAGPDACPCFGPTDIALVEAHALGADSQVCEVDAGVGTFMTGQLAASRGAAQLLVNIEAISGVAGFDYNCGAGCNDVNDDKTDDCLGATMPNYSQMTDITLEQHDSCEALIRAACS